MQNADRGAPAVCLGLYFFSKDATANLRRKDDVLNSAVGGFLGGGVLGLKGNSGGLDATWAAAGRERPD